MVYFILLLVSMIQRSEDKTVLVARDIHEIRHWTLIDLSRCTLRWVIEPVA